MINCRYGEELYNKRKKQLEILNKIKETNNKIFKCRFGYCHYNQCDDSRYDIDLEIRICERKSPENCDYSDEI